LVVWDSIYRNYVVYQENKRNLVFLHPDSIDNFFLKLGSGKYLSIMLNMVHLFLQNQIKIKCVDDQYSLPLSVNSIQQ